MEQVSKKMMDELIVAKIKKTPYGLLHEVANETSEEFRRISNWYFNSDELTAEEAQVKIIKHVYLNNPQFEAEKTKKYIVQIKNESAKYPYLVVLDLDFDMAFYKKDATKFDTREEAEKWTNPLMEVVEVEE